MRTYNYEIEFNDFMEDYIARENMGEELEFLENLN